MAFKQPDEKVRQPASAPASKPAAPPVEKSGKTAARPKSVPERLVSLDAYRGLTMLLLVSGGLSINRLVERHPEILHDYDGRWFGKPWALFWQTAASQLEHVGWTGCTVWDLIQPSFMFMVGVAMPFSYASRAARGDSWARQFGHALVRSLILILLGIFLRSTHSGMTNFTFEDVLTQIGLGYIFVFLLLSAPFWAQLLAGAAILGGSWFLFFHQPLPPPEGNLVTRYMTEKRHLKPEEWNQFTGLAAHWNKHTNAAAEVDRKFLNYFPRPEEPWEGKKFWINGGGYQTLNFVPSIVTMLLGVMAGQLLRSGRTSRRKLETLIAAGAVCFLASMAIDTTIWPFHFDKLNYSLCPIVKRIWTPSWVIFSAGWTFWFLAVFYWIVDMRGHRWLAFPLAIVGMNSIAVYCMDDLIKGWLASMLKIHLAAADAVSHASFASLDHWLAGKKFHPAFLERAANFSLTDLFYGATTYSAVWRGAAVLFLVWLICLWLYRRRIFIRV
jgi:predicted acyltransferase